MVYDLGISLGAGDGPQCWRQAVVLAMGHGVGLLTMGHDAGVGPRCRRWAIVWVMDLSVGDRPRCGDRQWLGMDYSVGDETQCWHL